MPDNITKLQVGGRYKADQLRKLSGLLKRGFLTRAEFERQKAELFGRPAPEDESDRGDTLIADALAMLAEPDAAPPPFASNVVAFEKR